MTGGTWSTSHNLEAHSGGVWRVSSAHGGGQPKSQGVESAEWTQTAQHPLPIPSSPSMWMLQSCHLYRQCRCVWDHIELANLIALNWQSGPTKKEVKLYLSLTVCTHMSISSSPFKSKLPLLKHEKKKKWKKKILFSRTGMETASLFILAGWLWMMWNVLVFPHQRRCFISGCFCSLSKINSP